MKPTFHAGKLGKSQRLDKLLTFLRKRGAGGATTMGITIHCGSTRPSSDVSELRHNGVAIRTDYEGLDNGRRIYRYTIDTTT